MLVLALALLASCGHQPAAPIAASEKIPVAAAGQLPFDRAAGQTGISPTSAVIPPASHVPAGTPVTIRLSEPLSSATAHSGDTFRAAVDEPVIVNGQTVIERGAVVMGRVLDAAAADGSQTSGYVRLALASILIRQTLTIVQSSSTLVKAGGRRNPNSEHKVLVGRTPASSVYFPLHSKGVSQVADVTVGADRSFTFRLREPVTLHD